MKNFKLRRIEEVGIRRDVTSKTTLGQTNERRCRRAQEKVLRLICTVWIRQAEPSDAVTG